MKKILLVLFVFSFAFSQTRTSVWSLPQWGTGDTLKAGAKNTTSLSNYSLNNAFARIDSIGGVQIDSSGLFRSVRGRGTGNLTIDAGVATATPQRIVANDSLYLYYNLFSESDALFQGNMTVGGYVTTDSIQTSGKLFLSDTLTVNYIQLLNGMSNTNGSISTRGFFSTGFASNDDGYVRFYNGTNSNYALLYASNIASSNKTLQLPNVSGTLATVSNSDSIQTTTVHAVLFNSEKIASATLNDTSALFTEWSTTSGGLVPIVRMKYLHKAGIKYVTARYYAYTGGGGDGWETQMSVGSLTQGDSDTNGSYGTTVQVNQLSVSGLTAGALYDLQFKVSINTSGTSYFKELIITAESN